jgi:hypothetical protein
MLADLGELENFPVFEGADTLARRIDSLPFIRGRGGAFNRLLSRGRLTPEVETAARKLVERTRRVKSLRSRLAKKTFGRAFAWAQNRFR